MKYLKEVISKILYGILVIILVATGISTLVFLGQVDPARLTFGQRADVQTVESKRAALGLNDPLSTQLLRYLGDISPIQLIDNKRLNRMEYKHLAIYHFSNQTLIIKSPYLRESYQTGVSVKLLIFQAFPITLLLAICAFGIALIIGIPLGVASAQSYNSALDKIIVAITSLGYSLPSYVIAMIVALIFAYYLQSITGFNIQGSIFELNELLIGKKSISILD